MGDCYKMENHLKTGGEHVEFKNKASGTHVVSPRCREVFEELKIRRKHRFIIYRIGDEEIDVESVGARSQTFEDLVRQLPFTDCRYCIFDQELKTHDGRLTSKLWFISWFPNNSTPYNKMAYTSAKTVFRETLPGVFDVQASSVEDLSNGLGLGTEAAEESDEDF